MIFSHITFIQYYLPACKVINFGTIKYTPSDNINKIRDIIDTKITSMIEEWKNMIPTICSNAALTVKNAIEIIFLDKK